MMPQQPQDAPPAPEAGAAPGAAPEGQQGDPATVISDMQKALAQLTEGLMGSPLPKEAVDHLQNSLSEYNNFMSIAGKSLGVKMPEGDQSAMGAQDSMSMGRKGVVPAGQPTGGKGVKPVPAY